MERDAFENTQLNRLLLFLYLVPVFGFVPACWRLYRRAGNCQQRTISRLTITLFLTWVLGYGLFETSGEVLIAGGGQFLGVSLLLMNSLLTSSYFLVNLWLMVQLWQHKPLKLPGFSQMAKHLP